MDNSSNEQTRSKRRKLSQEPATDPPTVERSSTFWFDDGNIVLQTSNTMFRVHKSVMKLHSTVFQDMFTISQPNDQRTIDGCLVVELTDEDDDWDSLLSIVYRTEPLYIEKTNVINATVMLAMLRLGQKYAFESFKQEALDQLRQIYPRRLKELDEILYRPSSQSESLKQLRLVPDGEEFYILKAILDLRIETVLPMAFYFCVRNRSLAEILAGHDVYPSDDHTVYLSPETKAALVVGKEKILFKYPKVTFSWWHKGKPSASCTSVGACKTIMKSVMQTLVDAKQGITRALDPLDDYSGLCRQCQPEAKAAHDAGRLALIDSLPSFFGLSPRDQLKDF